MRKLLNYLLPAFIIASLAVPLMPAQPVLADGEDWLTGYTYRRAITIDGSTAGVQTNYPIHLVVNYGEQSLPSGNPTGLTYLQTWSMPDNWMAYSHSQGAECDGAYLWWSGGDMIVRTSMANPDWNNPLALNDHARTDGTDMEQINGIHLHGDYIYATGIKFLAPPSRCFVKWYDKNTLVFVGEHELLWDGVSDTQEGIVYFEGYWWTTVWDQPYIHKYDTAWNYIGNVDLPGLPSQVQGHDYYNGQLWMATQNNPIYVYDYNGGSFTLATTIAKPAQVTYVQSFGITPDGQYLYWADFAPASFDELLHKFSISWTVGGGSAGLYCNNHSQTDFDDIRFTQSDGSTELDYFRGDYTASTDADFYVEVNSIPASPGTATIYMYYGKADASTTSNGGNTFTFFDDFPGASIDTGKWDGDTADTTVADSVMKLSGTGAGWKAIRSIAQFGPTVAQYAKIKLNNAGTWHMCHGFNNAAETHGAFSKVDTPGTYNTMYSNDGTTLSYVDTNWPLGSWFTSDILVKGGTNTKWFKDGTECSNSPKTTNPSNASDLEIYLRSYDADNIQVDWIAIGTYAYPAPSVSSYGVETALGGAPGGPIVATNNPTSVNTTAGTLQGSVVEIGDTSIAYRGFVWDTTSHTDPGDIAIDATVYANNWSEPGNWGTGAFSHELTALAQGQIYYYRAGARNNVNEWAYGAEVGMVTRPSVPTVFTATTYSTTQINLAWTPGTASTTTQIMRQIGTYPTSVTQGIQAYLGAGSTYNDTGLTPGVAYYYSAWAKTSQDSWYSYSSTYATATDTTTSGFGVITQPASSIGATFATLEGTLADDGGEASSMRFVWGTDTSYTGGSTVWVSGLNTGASHSATVTTLSPNTRYHFRAEAKHADESVVYGADKTFITSIEEAIPGEPGIDPPDIFRIDDIKVFTNYRQGGDQIYVIAYRIIYTAGSPTLDVGDYFDFQLFDGVVLKGQWPVNSWGYRPGSLYLGVASAPVWGGEYRIKIIGVPGKWETPPETYRDLTPGDWQGDVADGQLDTWVISLAGSLQSYYDTEMVDYTTGGQPVLSGQGAIIFNMGIPGLSVVRPNLFSPTWTGFPSPDLEEVDVIPVDTEGRTGGQIFEIFQSFADFLSLEVETFGALFFGLIYLIVAIMIGMTTRNAILGMGLASPVVIGGAWLGLVPMALVAIIGGIFAMYTIFTIWMKGV